LLSLLNFNLGATDFFAKHHAAIATLPPLP